MVASTTISCQTIGSGDSAIPAQNLQAVLGVVYGKAVNASEVAYAGKGTADDAAKVAYAAQGTADDASKVAYSAQGTAADAAKVAYAAQGSLETYVAPKVGKMDAEMDQIFTQLGLTRSK